MKAFKKGNLSDNPIEYNLRSLKNGDSLVINLDRKETSILIQSLLNLRDIYDKDGIAGFESHYLFLYDNHFFGDYTDIKQGNKMLDFIQKYNNENHEFYDDLENYISNKENIDTFARRIDLSKFNKEDLYDVIRTLEESNLDLATSIINQIKISEVTKELEENMTNSNEQFFQTFFGKNSFVLSFIIPTMFHYIEGYTYMGGKSIDNKGGIYTDLMYEEGHNNIAIIELKTPTTNLVMNTPYRSPSVYSVDSKVSGAVVQAKNQKEVFLNNMTNFKSHNYTIVDPDVYVIVADLNKLTNQDKLRSFELYRKSLKDIKIITYSEIISKLKLIQKLYSESDLENIDE